MSSVFARKALLQKGWANNVRLDIRDGRIGGVEADEKPVADDVITGCVIPGLCNAHSHAFQRALAGHTERRSPDGHDNFWSWRARMYELASVMDARALRAVARQAYTEMLASGYTTVAEFHYLHREPGSRVADETMFNAICDAASESGIRLMYVPVLYERAGFDKPDLEERQRQFGLDLPSFLQHHTRAQERRNERIGIGVGAHSLRAVSHESIAEIARAGSDAGGPIHIHIAEQQREVDQCMAANGRRPVRWLLENYNVGPQWCLVHATHMDADEVESLAQSDAVVCLCPSTEANLGDGLFPLHDFLSHGGRIAIGSDSHISINPFEELRWLEYGQRLVKQSRNIASLRNSHVGRELFERTLEGGAQASGQEPAGLCVGAPADLVALYDDDPMFVGHNDESRLDALIFSGYRSPIERVMVHGEWCVVDGDHIGREDARNGFAESLERLGASV